ncbi:MAG: 2'-5' RNA ligase family protein [Cyanobacteria bacterium P01_A01_bin.17]
MARYFIALLPPDDIQAEVCGIKQYFSDHYHSRKAFNSPPHITLQPPFEWSQSVPEDEKDAENFTPTELVDGLNEFAASQAPVSIQLSGFAAFAPRVIYINVLKTSALATLQTEVIRYFASRWGIIDRAAKGRAFVPHMTVAFRDLTKQNFWAGWAEFKDRSFEAQFKVTVLTLLRHTGQRWEVHQNFPLG